jgi:hypothetical protein
VDAADEEGGVVTAIVFMPGDGTRVVVDVAYVASDFPRNPDGTCAFCLGDPCAEWSGPDSAIARWFARNLDSYRNAHMDMTCPMCGGRPT